MKRRLVEKHLLRIELRGLRRLTAGLVHHRAPAWSLDGRWLCLQSGEGDDTFCLICDGKGRPAQVLAGPAEGGAAFAPDGSLLYGRRIGATVELWRLASGDHVPRRLLGGDGRLYRDPALSPDGRWLCYAADDGTGGPLRLWLLDLHAGRHRALPAPPPPDGGAQVVSHLCRPAWSPDGAVIYGEAQAGPDMAIYAWPGPDAADPELPPVRLTPAGVPARRPAPLYPGLFLCEQEGEGGDTRLWLRSHGPDDPLGPARPLTEPRDEAREPALVWRKGQARLACAMICHAADGEPQRYDLYVGRLAGAASLGAP